MRYHEPAVGLKLTCEARDLVAHGVALRCGQGVELLLQDVGGLHQIPVFIERSESVVETAWRDFVIAKTCVIEQLIEHAGLSERGHTRERRLMRVGTRPLKARAAHCIVVMVSGVLHTANAKWPPRFSTRYISRQPRSGSRTA